MASDLSAAKIVGRSGGIELAVKVVPGASRTKVVGVWGTALKIAVAAPPEGGKANAAVTKLLATVFGVRKAAVSILSGHATPLKRIGLAGLTVAAARARLTLL
jgi:uncharacterized protein (TIGR00251 family)